MARFIRARGFLEGRFDKIGYIFNFLQVHQIYLSNCKISYHLSFGYCTSHGYIYKAVVVHTVGYEWKNSDFMGGISKLSELFYSKKIQILVAFPHCTFLDFGLHCIHSSSWRRISMSIIFHAAFYKDPNGLTTLVANTVK